MVPKVLLLVQGDPNASGIGNIFLKDLVQHYPGNRLLRFSLTPTPGGPKRSVWCGHSTVTHYIPYATLPLASSYFHWKFSLFDVHQIVYEVKDLIHTQGVELIWAVLNSGFMITLTKELIEVMDIPFVSTVWDAPEYFLQNYHLDPLAKRRMLQDYSRILERSVRLSVSSDSMRNVFWQRYKILGIPLIHGLPQDLWRDKALYHIPNDHLTIGFAGSLYAKREWNAFLTALQSVGGGLDKKQVQIQFVGRFPRKFAHKAPFVKFRGYCSLPETLAILAKTDIAYLPYWFAARREYIVRTSFPNKMSTYLAAGLPIFFHGPRDSSPAEFIQNYPVGICCHSLKSPDILESLRELVNNPDRLQDITVARKVALQNALGLDVMLNQFSALIGISRDQLVQPDEAR